MASSPDSSNSCTRRRILGWSGAGVIAGLAGHLGWPRHQAGHAAHVTPRSTPPLAAQLPGFPPESSPSETPPLAREIRREDFLPHLKSAFQLDSGTLCTLVDVSAAQKLVSPTAGFTSFSLLFTAPSDFAAESKIHHLSHSQMGAMDLFLSPVGRSKDYLHLEAVCSQRV